MCSEAPMRVPIVPALLVTAAMLVIPGCAGSGLSTDEPSTREQRRIESVYVHHGKYATVNSYVFSNGRELVVLDVLRKADEARILIEEIRAMKLPLKYILISHGHTDHFTGMGVFREAFPDAKIVVASEDIKRAIKAYAVYMDSGGATEGEPALDPSIKPKSNAYPQGWDYEGNIEVLKSNRLTLPSGGTLELSTDYLPTEADFMTTVYSPDLNALFLADLGYNKVHFWLGDDISWQDIENWKVEMVRLKAEYAARAPKIYPGHGDPTDIGIFDESVRYLNDYTRVMKSATSRSAAQAEMARLYPDYKEADFFLKFSVENHVKE